jgi:hypothetical protein
MWTAALQADTTPGEPVLDRATARYSVLGIPVIVSSDVAEALDRVAETYGAFRHDEGALDGALFVELERLDGEHAYIVRDSGGYMGRWPDSGSAVVDLLGRIVQGVLARLYARGVHAIHAAALAYCGSALIVAGKSGQGKTTLALGLLRRGLSLLSDEFAIVDTDTPRILPYRRGLHIRPGTPELVPELSFLSDRPQHQLGGGIEWALAQADLERAFPGCLAPAAPLRYVLLLDGPPQPGRAPAIEPAPAAVAAMELLRGTWAASRDFAGALARIARLMDGVVCGRLRVGALDPTLDCVTSWMGEHHG